ncbi:MAG: hypothetical protein A2Z04_06260 [Chloroflexi bacterium RBG_16_57_9]|nr:MAG: hypothetical protein A2Z04_06260 [Chloroflexi bacterium RBG_16_57_9]
MTKTVLSDEVVLATDLKKRQRYWFDQARKKGSVTIVQGKTADLVLARRQGVAKATEAAAHAKTAAQFLREVITLKRKPSESAVFPWLRDLDDDEQQEFLSEFVDSFAHCSTTGDWAPLEEILEDWQATAIAHRNVELVDAWNTRGRTEEYVPMAAPDAT